MAATTTTSKDIISASRGLDAPSRALLNLWLRRGMDDAAIARLSGGTAEEVAVRRDRVVSELAQLVEASREEIRTALEELAGRQATPVPAPAARTASRAPTDPKPAPEPPAPALVLPGEGNGRPAEPAEPAAAETRAVVVPAADAADAAERPGRTRVRTAPQDARDTTPAEPRPEGLELPDTLAVTLAIVFALLLVLAVVVG